MLKQGILAFVLAGSMLAGPSMAHAKLQSSSPAKDARLTEPPKALSLTFNEAAQIAVLKLVGGSGEIPIAIDKNAKAGTSFSYPLPALAPGSYTVQWTVVAAEDGHVTKGNFAFSIAG